MNRLTRLSVGFCAVALLSASTASAAVTLEWTRQLMLEAGWLGSAGFKVAADAQGDVYVTGRADFRGTLSWEGVLAKYNASGEIQWTRHLPSTVDSGEATDGISIDDLGNVYVTGRTSGSLEGTLAGTRDAILASYDAGGNLQWLRQFGASGEGGGSNGSDSGSDVWADGLGNVYVAGYTYGSLVGTNAGRADAFLAKYDTSGANQWIRQFGTSESDFANGVTVDDLGNVFIAGSTGGSLGGANAGERDAYLAKYDSDGMHQWTQQYGSIENDFARNVATDLQGNVYLLGQTQGDLEGTNSGGWDTFLAKYDASGDIQWTRQFGTDTTDISRGITIDKLGGIYIAGHTKGDLGGANAGLTDSFVSKFDAQGELQWIHQFGTGDTERAYGIDVDGMGNLYVSGISTRAADGFQDPFLAKFSDVVVPEPSTWLMLLIGTATLLTGRRAAMSKSRR